MLYDVLGSFAFIDEDVIGLLIGVLFMMIPIIWILTSHQQRMARILRSDHQGQPLPQPEVNQMRLEMQQMRDLIAQQTMLIDSLASSQAELVVSERKERPSTEADTG